MVPYIHCQTGIEEPVKAYQSRLLVLEIHLKVYQLHVMTRLSNTTLTMQ